MTGLEKWRPCGAPQPRRSGAATVPPGGSERCDPAPGGEGGTRGRIATKDFDSQSLQHRCNRRAPAFGIRKKTVKPTAAADTESQSTPDVRSCNVAQDRSWSRPHEHAHAPRGRT